VLPLRDMVVQMIITSDNVATQIVVERLGVDALNAFCAAAGMSGTLHRFAFPPPGLAWDHPLDAVTVTTAADQGRLLELLLAGAHDPAVAERLGCSSAMIRDALDILAQQQHREMIPALLPFETLVANKTGRSARGRMDAGIVYDEAGPLYVLTAYADWVPDVMPDGLPGHSSVHRLISRLSRACWDHMRAGT